MEEEGIIDKFFITFTVTGAVKWKGRIESHIGMEYYLVQIFNQVPDNTWSYKIAELNEMKLWVLFEVEDQMQTAFELFKEKKRK